MDGWLDGLILFGAFKKKKIARTLSCCLYIICVLVSLRIRNIRIVNWECAFPISCSLERSYCISVFSCVSAGKTSPEWVSLFVLFVLTRFYIAKSIYVSSNVMNVIIAICISVARWQRLPARCLYMTIQLLTCSFNRI